jgi:hypothetical protein
MGTQGLNILAAGYCLSSLFNPGAGDQLHVHGADEARAGHNGGVLRTYLSDRSIQYVAL